MKTVKVEMYLDIDDGAADQIKQIEHHAEYLLDLENWPEIKSVHHVKVKEIVPGLNYRRELGLRTE